MDGSDGVMIAFWIAIAVAVGLCLFGDSKSCGCKPTAQPERRT